ncbi:MAG: response regulator [Nitrososphaeria archaeon]|nr:response regulator [Nitrososphaeria archaeon]
MSIRGKSRILVVDDDADILQSLKEILETRGYDVDVAENAQKGLEIARKKFFNLAILDIKLPDMEGTELLAKIHKEKPEMMKIMLTGYPSLDNAVQALNLGADAYLMKPVNPEELLRVVEEKLKEQFEAETMTEEKVAEWIEKRIQKLEQQK